MGSGGGGANETSSLWDWDSLLLQATPLLDPDDSSSRHHDQNHQELQQHNRRRRDPRLTCPNYLAGRVPCACSDEEDEEEQGRNKKRSRNIPSRCQVPSCGAELKGLKGYHQRHKVCLHCATSSSVFVRNQEQRYCQQCGKFHVLSDFDEDKRSCRRKLEIHNIRRKRGKTGEAVAPSPHASNNNNSEGTATNGSDEALSEAAAADASKTGLDNLEDHLSAENLNQEQDDFLALLLDDPSAEPVRQKHVPSDDRLDAEVGRKSHPPIPPNNASTATKKRSTTYTSPCPTRRISFKFYDWNPADFPRRLREQILEWLANMPVELEGYIRSGCTILTLFIAMPEDAWIKLREDWDNHLRKLIKGCESGFWDKGIATVFFDNNVSYLDHGIVSSPPPCERLRQRNLPVIEGAFPICMEAGLQARITIFGQKLKQPNSSLLVGSEGKYLPSCLVADTSFRLEVNVIAPQKHGVVLFEVKTDYGVSNFVPVLVADKKLCEEVGSLSDERPQQHWHDLVLDLGWVLRHVQSSKPLPVGGCPSSRLQELLIFSLGKGWATVTEKILQAMHKPKKDTQDDDGTLRLQLLAQDEDDDYLIPSQPDGMAGDGLLVNPCLKNGNDFLRRDRHFYVKAALCLVIACAGVCILLQQHPQQVMDLSASLRRCLARTTMPRMAASGN